MRRRIPTTAALAVALLLVVAVDIITAGVRGGSHSSQAAPVARRTAPPYAEVFETALTRRIAVLQQRWNPTDAVIHLSLGGVSQEFVGGNTTLLRADGFVGGVGRYFSLLDPNRHRLYINVELWQFTSAVGVEDFASIEGDHTNTRLGSDWAQRFIYPTGGNGRGYVGRGVDSRNNYFSLAFAPQGTVMVRTRCYSAVPITRAVVERYERVVLHATATAG